MLWQILFRLLNEQTHFTIPAESRQRGREIKASFLRLP